MIEIIASSLSDTHQTAESVAEIVKSGDLILLVGDWVRENCFTQDLERRLELRKRLQARHSLWQERIKVL